MTSMVTVTIIHHLARAHTYNTVCALMIEQANNFTKLRCMSHYFTNSVCIWVYSVQYSPSL